MRPRRLRITVHAREQLAKRLGATNREEQDELVNILLLDATFIGAHMGGGGLWRAPTAFLLLVSEGSQTVVRSVFPGNWRPLRGGNGLLYMADPSLTIGQRYSRFNRKD